MGAEFMWCLVNLQNKNMKDNIVRDLLLLLKLLLLPFMVVFVVVGSFLGLLSFLLAIIGFQTPMDVMDAVGDFVFFYWNKLPEFFVH